MKSIKKNYQIFFLLSIHFIVAILVIFLFDGTGEKGSGDSILHYLYAKHAPFDSSLFFNHWAKPMFVFLSFPFAQLGINGIKLFNVIVASLTLLCTYKTVLALNYKNAIVAPIILFFTPLYFILTFSGLTEILFALFTIYGTYLFVKKKYLWGCIIISFLPFVRSEGLIIIGVFGFFLLLKNQWKIIPYLIFGHVIYSIIGYFYWNDILWVFTKIPYAKLSSAYSSGTLFHFVHELFYVIGMPIYALLILGMMAIFNLFFKNKKNITNEISILVLGGFLSYFIAHSLFWYLGIFNSMGLKRVLVAVAPFIAIIALNGYNFITDIVGEKYYLRKTLQIILILLIIVFPFTANKSAINWDKDFSLVNSQKLTIDVVEYVKNMEQKNTPYLYTDPYISELLNHNHNDKNVRLELSLENLTLAKKNSIIIWDSWFGVAEHGVSEERIRAIPSLKELKTFRIEDEGREITFILFIKN